MGQGPDHSAAGRCHRVCLPQLHRPTGECRKKALNGTDAHEAGRAIWNFRCYVCHGYSGDGKTLAAHYMTPPPRDFHRADPTQLDRNTMLRTVRNGKPGTGMKGFADTLRDEEIALVVDFVRQEFMTARAPNTRYHTAENGWPDHERYRDAYPFASGELATDTPPEKLTAIQQRGLRLYFSSCVSCHDRGRVDDPGAAWEAQAVSYPRRHYTHREPTPATIDGVSSATPYAAHDQPPRLTNLTARQQLGETLFQKNCAFCHGADGTGKNWIGTFLEPHPRNLTDPQAMAGMSRSRLRKVIREGLPGTTMPAWQQILSSEEIEAIIAYVDRAFHPLKPH